LRREIEPRHSTRTVTRVGSPLEEKRRTSLKRMPGEKSRTRLLREAENNARSKERKEKDRKNNRETGHAKDKRKNKSEVAWDIADGSSGREEDSIKRSNRNLSVRRERSGDK